jgi:hypothetical protein
MRENRLTRVDAAPRRSWIGEGRARRPASGGPAWTADECARSLAGPAGQEIRAAVGSAGASLECGGPFDANPMRHL